MTDDLRAILSPMEASPEASPAEVSASEASSPDAIDLLVADHVKVEGLFEDFSELSRSGAAPQSKEALVQEICSTLKAHEAVENEVFFPAVRDALRKDDVLEEATVDQNDASETIAELSELNVDDEAYDEKVLALGAQISEHAEDEEIEVFPVVRSSSVDTESLAKEMVAKTQT